MPTRTYASPTELQDAVLDAHAAASAQGARPENSPSRRQLGKRGADRVLQVGRHHFAHLRAVSEGLSVAEAAARYLGIDHGLQARSAHAAAIDAVRALAAGAWPAETTPSLPQDDPTLHMIAAECGLPLDQMAEAIKGIAKLIDDDGNKGMSTGRLQREDVGINVKWLSQDYPEAWTGDRKSTRLNSSH